jgi:hypothetical protein
MTTKDKTPTANSSFALWGLTCFVETFVQGSTFVLCMNSSAKNPPQRKAANRYASCLGDIANIKQTSINKLNQNIRIWKKGTKISSISLG